MLSSPPIDSQTHRGRHLSQRDKPSSLCVASTPANDRGVFMRNARRSISIGAVVAVAALSFAGGLYFAVTYGAAPKLEGGVAKAAESPDSSPTGRSDGSPPTDNLGSNS
jgi:hypothetical protein